MTVFRKNSVKLGFFLLLLLTFIYFLVLTNITNKGYLTALSLIVSVHCSKFCGGFLVCLEESLKCFCFLEAFHDLTPADFPLVFCHHSTLHSLLLGIPPRWNLSLTSGPLHMLGQLPGILLPQILPWLPLDHIDLCSGATTSTGFSLISIAN